MLLGVVKKSEFIDNCVMALLEKYFHGEFVDFSHVPVTLPYKGFTRLVLEALRNIPYGKTCTYKEIAVRLGSRASRAVGQALKRNPIPIIVPCHRVVRSDGSLGGFSAGVDWKKYLLSLEGVIR